MIHWGSVGSEVRSAADHSGCKIESQPWDETLRLRLRHLPSLLLWMIFLQSRSLWQSTTGEPSVERCSFIQTISCSSTTLLGTSCCILDREGNGEKVSVVAHIVVLRQPFRIAAHTTLCPPVKYDRNTFTGCFSPKKKRLSLFWYHATWEHMWNENNWVRHAQAAHKLSGALACWLLGTQLQRNKFSVDPPGAGVAVITATLHLISWVFRPDYQHLICDLFHTVLEINIHASPAPVFI